MAAEARRGSCCVRSARVYARERRESGGKGESIFLFFFVCAPGEQSPFSLLHLNPSFFFLSFFFVRTSSLTLTHFLMKKRLIETTQGASGGHEERVVTSRATAHEIGVEHSENHESDEDGCCIEIETGAG